MKTHPAIKRIALALSWINALDIPEEEMERSASCAQELADVRAITARVLELKRGNRNPKLNHWTTAREEFIARVLAEAGVVLPNAQGQTPEGSARRLSEATG